jgi:hypothetical protein
MGKTELEKGFDQFGFRLPGQFNSGESFTHREFHLQIKSRSGILIYLFVELQYLRSNVIGATQ